MKVADLSEPMVPLSLVKAAFYKTFVGAGELWFPYYDEWLNTPRELQEAEAISAVDVWYDDFERELLVLSEVISTDVKAE